jgi:hypothetical protein
MINVAAKHFVFYFTVCDSGGDMDIVRVSDSLSESESYLECCILCPNLSHS